MQVYQGIGTEYGHDKFGITLDETDLARLANEFGFYTSPGENGVTTDQAYRLLSIDAERYVLVQAPKFGRKIEDVMAQLWGPGGNREQFATILVEVTGLELSECRKRVGFQDESA
jgi:hypothetical protein